jgi:hypothetical protein
LIHPANVMSDIVHYLGYINIGLQDVWETGFISIVIGTNGYNFPNIVHVKYSRDIG